MSSLPAIPSLESIVYFEDACYDALNGYLKKANHSIVFILVDSNTHEACLPHFMAQIEGDYHFEIIEIEAGEIHKNIETCSGVWNALSELNGDRKSLLINLGGGVVTDLGGFVACTFKRGINYVNVPTTLLAMVDASVGGKTGVDLGNLKNMIGVISESEMVLVDTFYLKTLPDNQLRSGLAEVLKHGLIQDQDYWNQVKDYKSILDSELPKVIHRSVVIKNTIVKQDPTEKNIRKFLNFGHTLGHAIESYYLTHPEKKELLHGEAIGIGMILEGFLSNKLTGLSMKELIEIESAFLSLYGKITIDKNSHQSILDLLIHDKKNENGIVKFVLLNSIGEAVLDQEVPTELFEEAFEFYAVN